MKPISNPTNNPDYPGVDPEKPFMCGKEGEWKAPSFLSNFQEPEFGGKIGIGPHPFKESQNWPGRCSVCAWPESHEWHAQRRGAGQ